MNREPAMLIEALKALALWVLAVVVAFGVDLTQAQQAAILGLIGAVFLVIAWFFVRGKVYAEDSVHPDVGDTDGLPADFDA